MSDEGGFESTAEAQVAAVADEKLGRRTRLSVRREIRKLADKLAPGERVLNLAQGELRTKQGLVVATDRRVMFVEEGLVRSSIEDFPYDKISAVETGRGMVYGSLAITVAGAKGEIEKVVPKDRAVEFGDYVRARIQGGPPTSGPPTPTPSSAGDSMERLQKLAALRDAGVISPEDFEQQKARILSEM
jgi:hypothetical protein